MLGRHSIASVGVEVSIAFATSAQNSREREREEEAAHSGGGELAWFMRHSLCFVPEVDATS